jgi:glucan phosphoethanolaminetransferase (alkaline phosphatase superfamily)
MALSSTLVISGLARTTRAALSLHNLLPTQSALLAVLVLLQRYSSRRIDVYNILWAVVFGFATLNILSLAARRFEPNRRGLTFGELMAVLIVLLSIFLLGWELLSVFHIFPIKLER